MWITILNIALAIILFIGILCQHSLKSMFEQIGKNLADIHEGNMLVADYSQFKDISPATHLVDIAAKYAGELSCLANNVANSLQGSDFFKNRALENDRATSIHNLFTIPRKMGNDISSESRDVNCVYNLCRVAIVED